MNVKEAIEARRSFRAFAGFSISREIVDDLARYAGLAPSCFNKQPWRYVFVFEPPALEKLHDALGKGNAWAKKASMLVAVCSRKDLDCQVKGRDYYLFDTGMATAQMMLRATELGLTTHGMAGFDEAVAKKALNVPEDYTVIALFAVGKHKEEFEGELAGWHLDAEKVRPERYDLSEFAFINEFGKI